MPTPSKADLVKALNLAQRKAKDLAKRNEELEVRVVELAEEASVAKGAAEQQDTERRKGEHQHSEELRLILDEVKKIRQEMADFRRAWDQSR